MTAAIDRPRIKVDSFDWQRHVLRHGEHLLNYPETRRELTRNDPILWAWLYFRHHLASPETGGRITFSQFHLDLCNAAKQWSRRDLGPAEVREAWVAPRGSGKSTWAFGILPAWALAHGHRRFIAAFADSAHQAQQHLASLKMEFDSNERLRQDFPDLCNPGKRLSGTTVADNQAVYVARSGAVFQARGADASTLGAKLNSQRPDLLLLDDIEPDVSNYSLYLKEKRLATVLNSIFGMNPNAVVEFVGTTTMPGSIMHDLVRQAMGTEPPDWVGDENIRTRYYPAIQTNDDGTERSLWPERWGMDYLQSIRHTRAFRLNFMNDPLAVDSDYWSPSDFTYGRFPVTRAYLSVDGAVTTKTSSDYTGLAVVSYAPAGDGQPARCLVEYAQAVKLQGAALRQRVMQILESFPHIGAVLVETNQGGDMWHEVLHSLPVKIVTVHNSENKNVRAGRLLNQYQMVPPRVVHAERLPALEEQQMAFPKGPNDDLIDSVGNAVLRFLKPPARPKAAARSVSPR